MFSEKEMIFYRSGEVGLPDDCFIRRFDFSRAETIQTLCKGLQKTIGDYITEVLWLNGNTWLLLGIKEMKQCFAVLHFTQQSSFHSEKPWVRNSHEVKVPDTPLVFFIEANLLSYRGSTNIIFEYCNNLTLYDKYCNNFRFCNNYCNIFVLQFFRNSVWKRHYVIYFCNP